MFPKLLILGYSEAAMILRAANITAILSIHGRREFPVNADLTDRLDLTFDDIEVPNPDDPVSLQRAHARQRFALEMGLDEIAPTPADAAAIIAFAESLRDKPGVLLCHCGAGVSRSPAAALICHATWLGPGAEPQCMHHIRQLRPSAVPNRTLIRFADELLHRNGRLLAALAPPTTR